MDKTFVFNKNNICTNPNTPISWISEGKPSMGWSFDVFTALTPKGWVCGLDCNMRDYVILIVQALNILAKVTMTGMICFAIYAFIFIPVFSLKWCALYVFSFVLVFCLERWSYNNFPYYDKDPWND